MIDVDPTDSLPAAETDPRFHERWFRTIPASDENGWVLLVGVVHGHPASIHRASQTVRNVTPEVLALELPNLALPLVERHAEQELSPARHGCEMTAAVAARGDARVAGIDAPNRQFVRELASFVRSDNPRWETITGVLAGATPILQHALRYRLAAIVDARTHFRLLPDVPSNFEVSDGDSPATQAEDEFGELSRSQSLLGAVELPPDVAVLDRLREATMAARIETLRSSGSVVAVLGQSHLDAVEKRLQGR